MSKTAYHISLKGYVGGYDFDRSTVDRELAKNEGKQVNVLIDSLGGSLATGLSISAAFKSHGNVNVHFVGLNASAATIASLGAAHISIDAGAMYLVHQGSMALFECGYLNSAQFTTLIDALASALANAGMPIPNIPLAESDKEGAFAKFIAALTSFFKPSTNLITIAMIKTYTFLLAILADKPLTVKDGVATVTVAQLDTIEDVLAEKDRLCNEQKPTIADLHRLLKSFIFIFSIVRYKIEYRLSGICRQTKEIFDKFSI